MRDCRRMVAASPKRQVSAPAMGGGDGAGQSKRALAATAALAVVGQGAALFHPTHTYDR